MELLKQYFNKISPLSDNTWKELAPLFKQKRLEDHDFFVEEDKLAKEIAFLETGVVRAFFTNSEAKEYNKQFFVGPSIIGAYTSLLTGKRNRIPQQALTNCVIWTAKFSDLERLFAKYHDFERLGRKIAEHYFLEKEEKELEMALMNATERYLLFRKRFPNLEQLIPQYHIASYLGVSATQLSRLRSKLQNLEG
ncbi:Crp/Fnr family transcriptional regulator [Flammeovirga agarivorans]|uniref:Crp/Fnr family transcriptional regulator n=1 Tax=Flammeovirga agarivorans TaxID=2726742 RepID=A0A7X8XYM2_9BACT|nr:Crp/Fnr family transcriptional regulator [Flammeovirga agarivorans]NLR94352.1 Crp/Fnr family transcriptional regulator [Flammeovirga agarivorans]